MSETKFGGFSSPAYIELPVQVAYLSWVRGDAKLASIAKNDPAAYLGGWRAFVAGKDGIELPKIPLSIVDRMSEDGKHAYQVYSFNYINFLPIQHRLRFELRQKTKDEQTGREYDRVVNISQSRRDGYAPYLQVFGLLYAREMNTYAPVVLKVWKWSAFISIEKADREWDKIAKAGIPNGKAMIRRYGTVGTKTGEIVSPKFEVFGQARSTPIEAVGVVKPAYLDITDEMNNLYEQSLDWKNCPRWNAEGEMAEDDTNSPKSKFLKKCTDMKLSNIDIEQLIAEAGGDYEAALRLLDVPQDDNSQEEQF